MVTPALGLNSATAILDRKEEEEGERACEGVSVRVNKEDDSEIALNGSSNGDLRAKTVSVGVREQRGTTMMMIVAAYTSSWIKVWRGHLSFPITLSAFLLLFSSSISEGEGVGTLTARLLRWDVGSECLDWGCRLTKCHYRHSLVTCFTSFE